LQSMTFYFARLAEALAKADLSGVLSIVALAKMEALAKTETSGYKVPDNRKSSEEFDGL